MAAANGPERNRARETIVLSENTTALKRWATFDRLLSASKINPDIDGVGYRDVDVTELDFAERD